MADSSIGRLRRPVALGVSAVLIVAACTTGTTTSPAAPGGSAAASAPAGPSGSPAASGAVGGSIALWTAWGGKELETFQKVLEPFTADTGIEVKITTVRDAAQLAINVEAGTTLPDIAGAPTADKIVPWAQQGVMKPLEDYLDDMAAYTAETLPGLVNGGTEIGVVDGKHYMMFVKTQVKNLFWYNAKVYSGDALATWDDLLKVQPPDGAKLFCVGLESGADSGWPATDNIEGIIMRQSGDQVYNAWWQGTHKWNTPEIKLAFQTFGQMVSEANAFGGPNTVLTTNFGRAGKPLFATPPGCVFENQATFITNFFLEDYPDLKPVDDFNFLPPPSYNSQFDGNVEFFFDNFVMYNDTPQARALMNYLWTADAQQIFVDAGGTLAANTKVTTFPDPVFQRASEVVAGASKLLVDGSDNMPAEMRSAFYKGILDFTKDQSQLDQVLADLDEIPAGANALLPFPSAGGGDTPPRPDRRISTGAAAMDSRIVAVIAAVIGIPIILIGYLLLTERLVGLLPRRWQPRVRPYLWIFPAVAFATVFMVIPTINTIVLSFQDRKSEDFVGFANYQYFFTNPGTTGALKNSLLWLVFFTGGVVIGGLLIAVLFDRVRYESAAKLAVFLPLPISAVAASIIWKFMFEYQPEGAVQTGTLNALIGVVGLGPVAWLVESSTNNPALIFVGIWISTGFAMVIISSALKAISPELLEAARLDGASELQVLRTVIVPLLLPTLTVITTTMIIVALKVFDIVYVLTGGAYDTDVIASQMFNQLASAGHYGRASAVGVILLIAIIPLLVINVRRFRREEAIR